MSDRFPEDDDRCVDVIDQACKVEQLMRASSEAAARAKSAPEQVQETGIDADGKEYRFWPITECVDCGEDIPAARLDLGKVRCITCQSAKETRGKQYGSR